MAYIVGRCLLQDILDARAMSQADLADKLNVKPPQINKYVKETQGMSYQAAYNISKILNCRMEDLYEWIEVGRNE